MIRKLIGYFRRPKCKNNHNCTHCVFGHGISNSGIIFQKTTCEINAR